jgi:cellulose biosynthesis protein BcsQ
MGMHGFDGNAFVEASNRSRRMQKGIREATFEPESVKTLRRFSSWEVTELILRVNQKTFQEKLRDNPDWPQGRPESDASRMRWFSIEEINAIREAWTKKSRTSLMPPRPAGKRALRAAVANFKGGAGKSTVALHFAHAAALDGYRVLVVDFDPQATISHAMGVIDLPEEKTVWGIIARDLILETRRTNLLRELSGAGEPIALPASIRDSIVETYADHDFVCRTCWPTVDIIGSCANAAFVEFATGEYRMANRAWSFFASMDRYLNALPPERYDLVIFDCPPAIGYQSLNAVFAADVLCIPTGPGYWEYDSTTSFMGQLGTALGDISEGFRNGAGPELVLPKRFLDVRVLMTRFEDSNELHRVMRAALGKVFPDWMSDNAVELTRAVEQSGRFLQSVYEIDYRLMTRETWKRARSSFDGAYAEFRRICADAWSRLDDVRDRPAEAGAGRAGAENRA